MQSGSVPGSSQQEIEDRIQQLLSHSTTHADNFGLWLELGVLCEKVGKLEDAESYLKRAIALEPDEYASYDVMGFVLQAMNQYEAAAYAFETGMRLNPGEPYPATLFSLAVCSLAGGNYPRCEELCRLLLEKHSSGIDEGVHELLVRCYQRMSEPEKLEEHRKRLHKAFNSGKITSPWFIRDKFSVEGIFIVAMEYFKFEGEYPTRYKFLLADSERKSDGPSYSISLASPEWTTQYSREVGEIGPDGRVFAIDGFDIDGNQHNLSLTFTEPTYDETVDLIRELIRSGRLRLAGGLVTSAAQEAPSS